MGDHFTLPILDIVLGIIHAINYVMSGCQKSKLDFFISVRFCSNPLPPATEWDCSMNCQDTKKVINGRVFNKKIRINSILDYWDIIDTLSYIQLHFKISNTDISNMSK